MERTRGSYGGTIAAMARGLLEAVFEQSREKIDALATEVRAKYPGEAMAILLERTGAGRVLGGAARRADALRKIESTRVVDQATRRAIVADVAGAPVGHLPVVLMVRDGDAFDVGCWRLSPPEIVVGFRVDTEQAFARRLAEVVRPLPGETVTVWIERAIAWARAQRSDPHAKSVLERGRNQAASFFTVAWTMAWGTNACPRVIVPARIGASLMASSFEKDPTTMSYAPWSAYVIEIPPDLVPLEIDGKPSAFDVIGVWRNQDGKSYFNAYSRRSDAAIGGELSFPVPDFPEDGELGTGGPAMKRAIESLQRLVLGVELEMTDPDRVKRPRISKKKPKDGRGPPSNIHHLTRTVVVDCREAIRDYIAGTRRKGFAMSWLTRGHGRWQPHGPRSSLRKWIFVEPRWNNRDAPVVMRPHTLRDEEKV
jgi:hypothetical protein